MHPKRVGTLWAALFGKNCCATDRFLFTAHSSGYSLYVHGARSLTLRIRHPSPDHSFLEVLEVLIRHRRLSQSDTLTEPAQNQK